MIFSGFRTLTFITLVAECIFISMHNISLVSFCCLFFKEFCTGGFLFVIFLKLGNFVFFPLWLLHMW